MLHDGNASMKIYNLSPVARMLLTRKYSVVCRFKFSLLDINALHLSAWALLEA